MNQKMNTGTAHIRRTIPVMALVAALVRLKVRLSEQPKLWDEKRVHRVNKTLK